MKREIGMLVDGQPSWTTARDSLLETPVKKRWLRWQDYKKIMKEEHDRLLKMNVESNAKETFWVMLDAVFSTTENVRIDRSPYSTGRTLRGNKYPLDTQQITHKSSINDIVPIGEFLASLRSDWIMVCSEISRI